MFNACLAPAPPTQTQDGGQGLPAKQVHSPTALKKDDWMGIAKQVHPPTALKKDDLMGAKSNVACSPTFENRCISPPRTPRTVRSAQRRSAQRRPWAPQPSSAGKRRSDPAPAASPNHPGLRGGGCLSSFVDFELPASPAKRSPRARTAPPSSQSIELPRSRPCMRFRVVALDFGGGIWLWVHQERYLCFEGSRCPPCDNQFARPLAQTNSAPRPRPSQVQPRPWGRERLSFTTVPPSE